MQKLIYHIACSADGFIAHTDHTVQGFLFEGNHSTDYQESLKNDYSAVLMGRKTYEFGLQFGVTSPYPWLNQYVISKSMESDPDPAVKLVKDDLVNFIHQLKKTETKSIYLCGGSVLSGFLLKAGLIDSLILKINPVIFGSGIPIFTGDALSKENLTLSGNKIYDNGVLLSTYQIN
jgi:dihydrofolate reductase